MKKLFLTTAFIALALSSQAFAANTDYNSDTRAVTDTGNTNNINSDMPSAGTPSTTTPHHRHKKSKTSTSTGRHPNAGNVPARSENMNDNATSRQGLPSGETNGPVNGQSDDQNYGQPTNH